MHRMERTDKTNPYGMSCLSASPAQQHPTAPLPPLHRKGLLHCLGLRNPDRQDKAIWCVVSVGLILPSLHAGLPISVLALVLGALLRQIN